MFFNITIFVKVWLFCTFKCNSAHLTGRDEAGTDNFNLKTDTFNLKGKKLNKTEQ